MYNDEMKNVNVDKLRKDMQEECYGAYFVGGYGGALMNSFDVERANPDRLVEMAQRQGINRNNYYW